MVQRRPLWLRWFLNFLQFDGLIGYLPGQLIFYVFEEVKPSASPASAAKKNLFIHAVISPLMFTLGLIVLNKVFLWDWQVLPFILAIYLVAIGFLSYQKEGAVSAAAGSNPAKERTLRNQLKIVKIMVVVWAFFILGIQILLP